jgi:farnesyl diphosphate synthase
MSHDAGYKLLKHKFDTYLQDFFITQPQSHLFDAMTYCCVNGGKRIRPILVLTFAKIFNIAEDVALKIALAVELVHCYSLVHDDLPSMDNDTIRRGLPTCHIKYGEDVAILVGDALQSLAFDVILSIETIPSNLVVLLSKNLAKSIGANGMVYGQYIDILKIKSDFDLSKLINMHNLKTGMLIKYAVLSSYLISNTYSLDFYNKLEQFGYQIGLLFQITDDILDATSNTEILGKTINKDLNNDKYTFVTLLGIDGAKNYVNNLYEDLVLFANNELHNEFVLYLINVIYLRKN